MTDKQPEALRLADELEAPIDGFPEATELESKAAAELRRLHAELETMRAKLKTYEDLGDAGSDVQLLRMGYAAARLEIESLKSQLAERAKEQADELAVAYMCGASREKELAAQQPGAAYAAQDSEHRMAIMQGERNASLDAYSRVVYLTGAESRLYEAGFTNGWGRRDRLASHGQAPAQAAPDVSGYVSEWASGICTADEAMAGIAKLYGARVAPTTPPAPQQEARPVTPYTCPKCHALWLHWPAEQSGFGVDTLNCRSATHCDYCEKGGVEQLERLERVPAAMKAPQQEAQEPVGYTHASWIAEAKRGGGGSFVGRKNAAFDVPIYTAPQPSPTPQADSVQDLQPVHDAVTIDLLNERVVYLERKLKEADSVLEDAARWKMAVLVGNEVMMHPEKRTHPAAAKAYMDAVHSGLDLTGAIDAARKQGANHD